MCCPPKIRPPERSAFNRGLTQSKTPYQRGAWRPVFFSLREWAAGPGPGHRRLTDGPGAWKALPAQSDAGARSLFAWATPSHSAPGRRAQLADTCRRLLRLAGRHGTALRVAAELTALILKSHSPNYRDASSEYSLLGGQA